MAHDSQCGSSTPRTHFCRRGVPHLSQTAYESVRHPTTDVIPHTLSVRFETENEYRLPTRALTDVVSQIISPALA